jgi:putative ABC transport system substrate-binding protein
MRRFDVFAVSLLLAAWFGSASSAPAGEVVVLMSAPVDDYEKALRGFKGSLRGHEVVKTHQMDGRIDRGREILAGIQSGSRGKKPDLVFTVGVWALQAALQESTGLPLVYAMVLNPASVVGSAPANVTGASMNVPVADSLRLLQQLGPEMRRVGVVFNQEKTGYLVKEAKALASGVGIELLVRSVRTPGEAIQAIDSLQQEGIDAFWFLPDETLLAGPVSEHVFLVSHRHRVPILGISERQAQMGAVLALTFASSEDIGSQAGELANSILGGKRASDVPSTSARRVSLTVNLKAARKLGLEIPESILVGANELIK